MVYSMYWLSNESDRLLAGQVISMIPIWIFMSLLEYYPM